jgi:hypothetical protein
VRCIGQGIDLVNLSVCPPEGGSGLNLVVEQAVFQ